MSKPDLIVSSVTAPPSATVGESLDVSWTVINQGERITNSNWYDYIYLSDDEFLDNNDTFVTNLSPENDTPLAVGDRYTTTQNIYIPYNATKGNRYLLFATDRDNYQSETNEDNNVFAQPITLNTLDLVVSDVTAPASAISGGTVDVSWTVTNEGTVYAPANWHYAIYFSTDDVLNNYDLELTEVSTGEQTPLAAGASYTLNQTVTIPSYAAGGGYLLFVADGSKDQGETDETDNVRAVQIEVAGPDLVLDSATAPTFAALGETISVSWTVNNQSDYTALANWYDTVFISNDPFLNSDDVPLTNHALGATATPLVGGASYTVTQNITIPNDKGGSYLLFAANTSGEQGEANKTNNVLAKPITLSGGPNLVLTNATSPTAVERGEIFSVSWTVQNQSSFSAPADWYDYIYLSTDDVLDDGDTYVTAGSAANNTPLVAGASYTATQNITLPIITSGNNSNYYLLFAANRYKGQAETNGSDNILAKPISLVTSRGNSDRLGVTISESNGSTKVTEGGATDTYTVALTHQPTADVAIAINDNAQITASVNTLTFTAANWHQAQTVTVAAVDDDVIEGNHDSILTLTVINADASYNGIAFAERELGSISSVNVSIEDNDQLINGTSRCDTLTGSDGNDIITGFKGADILTGGAASDQFVYTSIRDAGDQITDFVAGTDKIDLIPLFQSLSLGDLNYGSATSQGYLSFGTKDSNTTVLIDADGLEGRGHSTTLLTVQGLDQTTLANAHNFVF
jgi:Ca2+-binding RTX toxin-like protein